MKSREWRGLMNVKMNAGWQIERPPHGLTVQCQAVCSALSNDGIWFSLASPASVVTHRRQSISLSFSHRLVLFLFSQMTNLPLLLSFLSVSFFFLGCARTLFFLIPSFSFLVSHSLESMCTRLPSLNVKVAHSLNDPGSFTMHKRLLKFMHVGNQRKSFDQHSISRRLQ